MSKTITITAPTSKFSYFRFKKTGNSESGYSNVFKNNGTMYIGQQSVSATNAGANCGSFGIILPKTEDINKIESINFSIKTTNNTSGYNDCVARIEYIGTSYNNYPSIYSGSWRVGTTSDAISLKESLTTSMTITDGTTCSNFKNLILNTDEATYHYFRIVRESGQGAVLKTAITITVTYSTGPTDLSTGTVEGTFNPSTFTYNGTNQYPSSYNIYFNESLLIEEQDYNLSWPSDSYSVGTKDVEITGIGNYTGTVIINNAYEITGILIEDITLSPLEDSIIIGDTIQIEKTIYPEDATIGVIWSSTNPSIASVNNKGLVTGLSEGTTTIYCSSEFDSSIYGMSKITVTSATIGVTKIILTSNGTSEIKETLMRSDHSLHLYPVITPDNATNQNLKWKSSDESIATVFASEYGTAGIVYSNDLSGEVTITCTSEDNPSISASCKITVIKFSITPSQIEVMEGETGTFSFSVEPASYLSQVVASPALGNFSTSISNNIITIYDVKYDTSEYGNNLGTFYIYIAGYGSTYFYHNNSVIILPAPERIPVTGLSLDKKSLTLRVEKDIGTVTATISPENASNLNIIWENDDNIFDKCIETSISILNNTSTITIIPVKAGTVTLTAYAEENREIIATCVIKITDLGSVYIYIDGEYKPAKAYIYNEGWQECSSIYIYNNGWKQTITI